MALQVLTGGKNATTGAPPPPPPPNPAATPLQRVQNWRHAKIKDDVRVNNIVNVIMQEEASHEGFVCQADNGGVYLFNGRDHRLYPILTSVKGGVDPVFGAHLDNVYGLLYVEKLTRQVVCRIETLARMNPNRPKVRRFSHWDVEQKILYVSQYNGMVWRLDGSAVTSIPNGAEVLFLDDDGNVHCDADIGPHDNILRKTLVSDVAFERRSTAGMSPEQQRAIFECYIYALAFNTKVKPIGVLEGLKDSGKSSTLQRIQIALAGHDTLSTPSSLNAEDLAVVLSTRRLVVLDNVDNYYDWLAEFLAGYATGAVQEKRTRYTDNKVTAIKPEAFITITTRNPASIARPDTADRLLIFRLGPRASHGTEEALFRPVYMNRPKILGEWLHNLNGIVAHIRSNPVPTIDAAKHRLADFVSFAEHVAVQNGIAKMKVAAAFDAAQAERNQLVLENDPMIDLFEEWLKRQSNINREVNAKQLYQELTQAAFSADLKFKIQSPVGLIRYMKEHDAALRIRFGLDTRVDRHVHGTFYCFTPPKSM